MKEWSVPTVMNVNRQSLLGATTLLLALFYAPPSVAGDVIPSLTGVQGIVVHHARMGNDVISGKCNLSSRLLSEKIVQALKANGLPGLSVVGTPPNKDSALTVELLPDVVSLQPRDNVCVSWVSFSVQTRNAIQLAENQYPRDVFLLYWKGGSMISSLPTTHQKEVDELIDKLATQFANQFFLDQPPAAPKG